MDERQAKGELIGLNEAVDLLMKRGMSRRSAKRMLLKGLRDGTVRSRATYVEDSSGKHFFDKAKDLPRKFWQGHWEDSEGDDLEPEEQRIESVRESEA